MNRQNLATMFRALRRRKGWSQGELAAKLDISQQTMSRLELGQIDTCSVELLDNWTAALGGYLLVDVRVSGERPLTDARHASLQAWFAGLLRADGWDVEVESSFNDYGDRGRVDVLAFHRTRRLLLVVEIKTRIQDVQDMLGRLDIKCRVARNLARERGWDPIAVVPTLVVTEARTARRRVTRHAALFGRFALRARAARAWLRAPDGKRIPRGILLFATVTDGPSPGRAS